MEAAARCVDVSVLSGLCCCFNDATSLLGNMICSLSDLAKHSALSTCHSIVREQALATHSARSNLFEQYIAVLKAVVSTLTAFGPGQQF